MSRSACLEPRIFEPNGSPPDVANDFGLGWIRQQVGQEQAQCAVVLACARRSGSPLTAADGAFISSFRAVVERLGGSVSIVGTRVIAVWGEGEGGHCDVRLAGFAGLALAAECQGSHAGVSFGIHSSRISTTEGTGFPPELLAALASTAEAVAAAAADGSVAVTNGYVGVAGAAFEVAPICQGGGGVVEVMRRLVGRRLGFHDRRLISPRAGVGRLEERRALEEAWSSVRDGGRPRIVIVTGEPGIGKSTLVRSLMHAVEAEDGVTAMTSCAPHPSIGLPGPPRQLLERLAVRKDAAAVQAGGPGDADEQSGADDRILGVRGIQPLLLVVEDVQWADRETAALIGHIGLRSGEFDGQGLLFILTAREMPEWLENTRCDEVRVGRLDNEALVAVLDSAGVGRELGEGERRGLIACSHGNPLVALELARSPQASPSNPGWQQPTLGCSGLVSGLLARRLIALGALRPLAQAAAIFPEAIKTELLAEVLSVDKRWLQMRLADLEDAGIVTAHTGRRGRWYRFSHRLLREAAYESMVFPQRQRLHLRAALALTSRAQSERFVEPKDVAEHFSLAGRRRDAFAWLQRAAEKAAGEQAPQAAVEHLERALDVADLYGGEVGTLAQIEALRQLGVSMIQVKGSAGPEVRSIYERALALCETTPGVPGELHFDLLWGLDAFLLAGGEVTKAHMRGEQMLRVAAQLGDRQRIMLARRMHAVSLLLAGRLGEAIELYLAALAVYDAAQDSRLRFEWASDQAVVAHAHLCWAYSIAGDLQSADRHMRAALAAARRLDHAHSTTHALGVLATAAQIRGDRGAAGAFAVAARALAEHNGFPYWTAWSDIVAGWVAGSELPEDGLVLMRRAIEDYRRTGAGQALPYALLLLAEASLRRGDPHTALEAVEAARAASRDGIMLWNPMIYCIEAAARIELGGVPSQVEELLCTGREIAQSQGAQTFAERCRLVLEGSRKRRRTLTWLA